MQTSCNIVSNWQFWERVFTSLLRRWKSHRRHVTENHNDTSISAFCIVLFRWFIAIATVVTAAVATFDDGGVFVLSTSPNKWDHCACYYIHACACVRIRVPLYHHHFATLQKFPDTKMKCRKINTRKTCTNHKHEYREWGNYIDKTWQRTPCFATERTPKPLFLKCLDNTGDKSDASSTWIRKQWRSHAN